VLELYCVVLTYVVTSVLRYAEISVSSNPVEGRAKIFQLKGLILTLFGLKHNVIQEKQIFQHNKMHEKPDISA
jgi:hypothetical protein